MVFGHRAPNRVTIRKQNIQRVETICPTWALFPTGRIAIRHRKFAP